MLEYKGYHAEIEFDEETNYYCGWLYGIDDLVMFGGETEKEVEEDFHLAVEDYLEFCRADGKEPNREVSNDLGVRVNSKLYDSLTKAAKNAGESLNELVERVLTDYIAKTA